MRYKLHDSLGFLVNRLAMSMRWALEKKLEKYDLTAQQYVFLARLFEEDGQPLSTIAKTMSCDKPTITGIAGRLEKKGLIIKAKDEEDRRIVKAVLTKKGRGLKEALHGVALDVNAEAVKGFTDEEIKQLKANLRKSLCNVLEPIEGGVIKCSLK